MYSVCSDGLKDQTRAVHLLVIVLLLNGCTEGSRYYVLEYLSTYLSKYLTSRDNAFYLQVPGFYVGFLGSTNT